VAQIKVGAATETAMKERKDLIDDALAATRAAIEEGIVPGGGVALLRSTAALDKLKLEGDEKHGADLVRAILERPLRMIAENAGLDGAVVANKVKKLKEKSHGYDALNDRYGDMFEFGVVDPAKVVRSALQNAASVACLLMTTDSIVVDEPKKEDPKEPEKKDPPAAEPPKNISRSPSEAQAMLARASGSEAPDDQPGCLRVHEAVSQRSVIEHALPHRPQ